MTAREYVAEVAKALGAYDIGFGVRRFRKGKRARIQVDARVGGRRWGLSRMYLTPTDGTKPPALEAAHIVRDFHRARGAA